MLVSGLKQKIKNSSDVAKRFPISVFCIVLAFCISFFIESNLFLIPYVVSIVPYLCIITLFFINWTLFSEKEKSLNWPWIPVGIGLGGLLVADIYFFINDRNFYDLGLFWDNDSSYSSFISLVCCLLLGLLFSPFLKRGTAGEMWWFRYQVLSHVSISTLACLILSAGVGVLYYTLSSLFGLTSERLIWECTRVLWMMIFPFLILSGFPKEFDEPPAVLPLCVKLISYVSAPILLIYGIILYLYAGKIAITGEMPQGQMSLMVIGFAITGILTYTEGFPLKYKENGDKFLSLFKKVFFPLLVIPLILLGIAIIQRVNQYGLTEARYVVILCLIWLSITVIASLLTKANQFSRIIGLSLIGLLFVAHLPALNPTDLSVRSQTNILRHTLEQNNFLKDNQIVLPTQAISGSLRDDLYNKISFLSSRNGLKNIQPWFDHLPEGQNPFVTPNENRYFVQSEIIKVFEVKGVLTDTAQNQSFSVNAPYNADDGFSFVDGYSFMKTISVYESEKEKLIPYGTENRYFSVFLKNNRLTLKGYKETFQIDLSDLASKGALDRNKPDNGALLLPHDIIIEQNGEKIKVSITHFYGSFSKEQDVKVTNVTFTVLYKTP